MTGTLVGVGAFCVAGLVQGCTGFGCALVAAPCLLMYFEPTFVVAVITLMSLVNTSLVSFQARRHVLPRLVGPLALGGVVGSPVGITLLVVLNPDWLKVGVAAFVVAFALVLLSGWSKPIPNPKWSLLPIGLVSGILGGTTGISGPPVILFLANQGTPKEVFRGNIACYFTMVSCMAISVLTYKGLVGPEVLLKAGIFLPAMLAGTYLGVKLSHHVSEGHFRKGVVIGVGAMGLMLLATSLRAVL